MNITRIKKILDIISHCVTAIKQIVEKIIPKKGSIFVFELPTGEKVEINGNILSIRPEDRIKKRFKKI